MGNLKTWIVDKSDGEPIEAAVIGNMGWDDYGLERLPTAAQDRTKWDRLLDWTEVSGLLDYEFSSGYGAPGCQSVTVWTKSKGIIYMEIERMENDSTS